ncbi:MAG TPA: MMPL family transporter [Candidatus Paceibacterota bacterium]|nr:MMPL family transporter [Candidatus Paceibacterota bacterium]
MPASSWAMKGLTFLARAVFQYPRLFFYPQAILLAVSLFYTWENLQFNTSRNDLVGKDKRYHHNFLQYRQEFPNEDDLVVVVESEDIAKNRQFVERLGARLESRTNIFTGIFYKGDLKLMGSKALLFLDAESLRELHRTLSDFRPFIRQFTSATNLNSLFQQVNRSFRTAQPEQNAETESLAKALPALKRILDEAEQNLNRRGDPPSPGLTALFGAGPKAEREMYITYGDGQLYLVTAQARSEDLNEVAVAELRRLVRQTQAEVPGVNVGITGESVLEIDEMAQSQKDTTMATVVSLVLVALIFIYGYQETASPLKATACLMVGLIYTFGFTTLVIGHLNILTITFLPMLIGLAIDFGVHLISRYEEEMRLGRTQRKAMEKAMVFTGLGVFTGCLTTAGAFLAMSITNFKGIQEMGVISGGGLLICLLPMITLLPLLLLRRRYSRAVKGSRSSPDRRARWERLWLSHPFWVLGVTVVLSLMAVSQAAKVRFDYNLLNMQSAGLPAVVTEKKLIHSASNSVLFGVMMADSLSEARQLEARLKQLSTVASVRSVSSMVGGDQTRQLEQIGEIKRLLSDLRFAPMDTEPVDIRALDQTLWALRGYLGLAVEEVEKEPVESRDAIGQDLKALRESVQRLRYTMGAGDSDVIRRRLAAYQQALFRDVHETFETLRYQDNSGPLRPEDLPPALHSRFVGRTGKLLVQVYPRDDVWQRKHQETFISELREIDPDVTGTPVQLYEYTNLLKQSYEEAAMYALAAIAVMIFIHFRRISSVILALVPVGVGTLWMVGFMGWWGIPFNPANIMTLPLVIGIGVTNGIHILNRFVEEQSPGIFSKSTGKAVLVSALTTVAGFGSLVLAKHQGIASLGWVMGVGTTTCMIVAVTLLPALLQLLIRSGWSLHRPAGKRQ